MKNGMSYPFLTKRPQNEEKTDRRAAWLFTTEWRVRRTENSFNQRDDAFDFPVSAADGMLERLGAT